MRYLTIMTLSVLLSFPAWVFAQTAPDKTSEIEPAATVSRQEKGQKDIATIKSQTSEFSFAGKEKKDFLIKMGESLKILATGEFAASIKKTPLTRITLYLNGVPMANMTPSLLQYQAVTEVTINFDLVRNSNDNDNRKAWDLFLKKNKGFMTTIKPAIAVGNELPMEIYSSQPIKFYVATDMAIYTTLFIGLVIFLVTFFCLVKYTNMLCDKATGYYSLGKSQMAFWGLLVLIVFTAIWVLTGTMERIPPQVLILLGISSATALSSVIIGDNKRSNIQNSIATLQKKNQDLLAKHAQTKLPLSDVEKSLLNTNKDEIKALSQRLHPGETKNFWKDICDDGNGLSFHRLQVVIWTLVLAAVFVRSVADVMSMPEFSDTLLILMGISSGTYVGFKFPEK